MDPLQASRNLELIRTLMERSAIYRRALAPLMLLAGSLGTLAAAIGWFARVESPRAFVGFWLSVAVLAIAGCFLLLRRQALRDAEPLWSPPTRRVLQALLPALAAGLICSTIALFNLGTAEERTANIVGLFCLPLGWIVFYGCAVHAAGFFMPRGIRLFGWIFILGGSGLFALGSPNLPHPLYAHGVMGLFFGVLHLALAWGLFEREPWARFLGLVLGFLALVRFPFGTALGIYTLWVLLPESSGKEYDRLAQGDGQLNSAAVSS